MTWTVWAAIVIVILTVAALIKRYETRLVLLASGFLMTLFVFRSDARSKCICKIYDKQRVDHGNLLCDGLCFCRSNDQMRCSFSEASVGSVK